MPRRLGGVFTVTSFYGYNGAKFQGVCQFRRAAIFYPSFLSTREKISALFEPT
jgi:hypothetical protein